MKRTLPISIFLLLAICAACVASGAAAAGVDLGYGEEGVVRPPAPEPITGVAGFGPVADGSAYVLGKQLDCQRDLGCETRYSLTRYAADGTLDGSFGSSGAVALQPESSLSTARYSVVADEGAALVGRVAESRNHVVLRRFTGEGPPDPGFGSDGVVRIPCTCRGAAHLHALIEPDGRILLDIDTSLGSEIYSFHNGTRVRLTRLLADGSLDESFGTHGKTDFTIRGPGAPTSIVRTAGGDTLIGGFGTASRRASGGEHNFYLRKVSAAGKLLRGFDRNAERSLERFRIGGKFPTLLAAVQGSNGAISVLGNAAGGFDLRLLPNGRPDFGFARFGVLRLPFSVRGAVAGTDGGVLAVGYPGERQTGYFRAFRILRNGALDPAFAGAEGLEVPVFGVRLGLTALGGGRVMVTDTGNHRCRSACNPKPSMVRLLE